jgi:hypothetical protein
MKYIKPEFDVTVYEVEDVITASDNPSVGFGSEDPNPGTDYDTNWFG